MCSAMNHDLELIEIDLFVSRWFLWQNFIEFRGAICDPRNSSMEHVTQASCSRFYAVSYCSSGSTQNAL